MNTGQRWLSSVNRPEHSSLVSSAALALPFPLMSAVTCCWGAEDGPAAALAVEDDAPSDLGSFCKLLEVVVEGSFLATLRGTNGSMVVVVQCQAWLGRRAAGPRVALDTFTCSSRAATLTVHAQSTAPVVFWCVMRRRIVGTRCSLQDFWFT